MRKNIQQNVDGKFNPNNARKPRENRVMTSNKVESEIIKNVDQKFPNNRGTKPRNNYIKNSNPENAKTEIQCRENSQTDPKFSNQHRRRVIQPKENFDTKNGNFSTGRVFNNSSANQKFSDRRGVKPTLYTNNSMKNKNDVRGDERKRQQVAGTSRQIGNKKVFETKSTQEFRHFNNNDPFNDLLVEFNKMFNHFKKFAE